MNTTDTVADDDMEPRKNEIGTAEKSNWNRGEIKMDLHGEESNEATEETDSSTCRLRIGLNEDCLLTVMKYLNVYDLLQMSKTDNYFKDLISRWIVGKKLLNLRGMPQSLKVEVFEMFGKWIRKFVLYETDFNNFIDMVTKHCTPARLTEVELNLKQPLVDNFNKMRSMPYFVNMHKFKLNVMSFQRFSTFDEFLIELLIAAKNLRHLQLLHVDIVGQWLKPNQALNLTDLRLLKPCLVSTTDLKKFLRHVPQLQRFTYKGEDDITLIGNTLAECCPNLDTFEDIHTAKEYRRSKWGGTDRYSFLDSFQHLSRVTLTTYSYCGSDLYHPLTRLAAKNITQLKVYTNLENAEKFDAAEGERILKICSFKHFRSLLTLELDVRNFRLPGDLHCEFILHFASQLKNLEKFTLECSKLISANKIFELLPRVRTISISKISFKHLPVEMRRIVRTLRAMRLANGDEESDVLQLVVSMEQWRELQVYKDINSLTRTIIDPYINIYNYRRDLSDD